jgi:3-hydroxypropanoate dehydrogenase
MPALDDAALAQLFTQARTHNAWLPIPIEDSELHALYDLLKWGPTSANISPARFVFVKSKAAKERLRPALDEGNLAKTMVAPVTVIVATDFEFYKNLPRLFPHSPDSRSWFEGKPDVIQSGGFRNGTLQGAYLILAARALGLDCGPMSGFNNAKVDAEFFAGTAIKSNFLVNLAHGDPAALFPRSPRLPFEEACRIE